MIPQYTDCVYLVERVVDGVTHLVLDQTYYDLCAAEKQELVTLLLLLLLAFVLFGVFSYLYLTRE